MRELKFLQTLSELEQPDSSYEAWGGTSMATPHVSGVAALIWSADPGLTNAQIRAAMNATALDLGDPGRDVKFGYGLVQAADALAYLGLGSSNNKPEVSISSPADGAIFDLGVVISFTGEATDVEDGNLTASLVWTSDLDGQIGVGTAFSAVLSEGSHIITASVTDSGGAPGSDSITVIVSDGQPTGQLIVGVSTDKEVYSRKATAIITVTVDDETGAPVDGASVAVTVTSPNGGIKNLTAATVNGLATLNYNVFTRRDGSGVYTVNVTATKDSYDPGSAYTEFEAY